jgi:hypothetical protein
MIENNIEGKIVFNHDGTKYTLRYQRYYLSSQVERVKVFGKSTEIHFQSNRPVAKNGKKKTTPKWKIIEPISKEVLNHPKFIHTLLYVLESVLDSVDFPRGPYVNPKDIGT